MGQMKEPLLTTVKFSFDLRRTSEDEGSSSRLRKPSGRTRNTPTERQSDKQTEIVMGRQKLGSRT